MSHAIKITREMFSGGDLTMLMPVLRGLAVDIAKMRLRQFDVPQVQNESGYGVAPEDLPPLPREAGAVAKGASATEVSLSLFDVFLNCVYVAKVMNPARAALGLPEISCPVFVEDNRKALQHVDSVSMSDEENLSADRPTAVSAMKVVLQDVRVICWSLAELYAAVGEEPFYKISATASRLSAPDPTGPAVKNSVLPVDVNDFIYECMSALCQVARDYNILAWPERSTPTLKPLGTVASAQRFPLVAFPGRPDAGGQYEAVSLPSFKEAWWRLVGNTAVAVEAVNFFGRYYGLGTLEGLSADDDKEYESIPDLVAATKESGAIDSDSADAALNLLFDLVGKTGRFLNFVLVRADLAPITLVAEHGGTQLPVVLKFDSPDMDGVYADDYKELPHVVDIAVCRKWFEQMQECLDVIAVNVGRLSELTNPKTDTLHVVSAIT